MAKASIASLFDYVAPHCWRMPNALQYVEQIPVAAQWGYIMGYYGQVATSGKWKGRKCADCNGLFEDDLARQLGGNHNTLSRYNYSTWCKGYNGSDMTKMPQVPGCAVFRADKDPDTGTYVVQHVGVLWRKTGPGVKDWLVLEAANSSKGYICSKMGSAWNRWGLMKAKYNYDLGDVTEPTTPTVCPYTVPTVLPKYGDKNSDSVRWLQWQLIHHGFDDLGIYGPAKDGIDGDYGDKTRAEVTAFQKNAGLPVGMVTTDVIDLLAGKANGYTEYTVKRGDRLWDIAIAHGLKGPDWVRIKYKDGSIGDGPPIDPKKLQVGAVLLVPKAA